MEGRSAEARIFVREGGKAMASKAVSELKAAVDAYLSYALSDPNEERPFTQVCLS